MELEVNKISHDSEKAAHGQQVLTACAFIYKKTPEGTKLFMPKRANTKKFLPWVFELPWGHIDFWEDMKDWLKREIDEEFSMQIEIWDCFEVFTYTNDIKWTQSLEAIYFANFIWDERNIILHPEDHQSFLWIWRDELSKILSDGKWEDDLEIQAVKKWFSILEWEHNWDII